MARRDSDFNSGSNGRQISPARQDVDVEVSPEDFEETLEVEGLSRPASNAVSKRASKTPSKTIKGKEAKKTFEKSGDKVVRERQVTSTNDAAAVIVSTSSGQNQKQEQKQKQDKDKEHILQKSLNYTAKIRTSCLLRLAEMVPTILSYLIVSYRILSYLILSYRILSYLIVSYRILSYLILSYRILSYLILSYRILSYLIVSYLIVSYLILSYLILSYLIDEWTL